MSISYKNILLKNVSEDSIKSFKILNTNEVYEDMDTNNDKYNDKDNSKSKVIKEKRRKSTNNKYGFKKKNDEDKDKITALLKAQDKLIIDCLPSKNEIDEMIISLSYTKNWGGKKLFINTSDDEIKINHKNKNYIFSKNKFFNNNKFKYNLVKKYNTLLKNDVWINIRDKIDNNTNFKIITIKKKS
tara:strand:- start:149 stop:706 length:558 start_codon:yes stop_codon:yes gene_type:complete